MTDLVIRPLVAGEEELFDSMPDPLPQLRQTSYADGIAGGGYRPEHTWIALRAGRVVGRAAWLLPPGSVGDPWLERFDLDLAVDDLGPGWNVDAAPRAGAAAEVGAALLRAAHEALGGPKVYYASLPAYWRRQPQVRAVAEVSMAAARRAGLVEQGERLRCSWTGGPLPASAGRFSFRPAAGAAEINDLVARIAEPVVLTGAETARVVAGVDLARDPLAWLAGTPLGNWRVALAGDEPVGLAGPTADACYPMIAYLGLLDEAARGELLADAVATLAAEGAYEVVADVDAHRVAVVAELERTGFRRLRSRVAFAPA
ncbi:acetyltransferase [Micromonospora sp. WMMD1082]|uniref:acetyltransferase n=1 Tax=Micromonospora sp. WMMD1082 TaxID=3016104 RepID=UPI00241701E1|nr:acetyltransferase [Micromonospora sp. WMMD1082]MDG4796819.1 acetyltransferase [Micromonospora sp. WMMD1082]